MEPYTEPPSSVMMAAPDVSSAPLLTTHMTDLALDNTTPSTGVVAQAFDKQELLRQVDHYFSDEGLQFDAHLLGKLQEGNGTVSIAQVTGWPRMRKFRPLSAVKEALKESSVIEIINNKRIKRRTPFDMAKAKVEPRTDEEKRKMHQTAALKANPYLSKAMLKRTGFEHDHIEPDLTNEEQQIELEQYSTEHPIYERLETAVLRYKMNRKFHQETLRVFHAYLNYGGFDERPPAFTGGISKEEEEGMSKEEKAMRKQVNYISRDVAQSIDGNDGKWIVDFDGVTKGFFSTPFPVQFLWHDEREHDKEITHAACNVLRNFFNYLLYHNVCEEYTGQIKAARDTLGVVKSEYAKLAAAQTYFPGSFCIACSTLLNGYYSSIGYQGDWMTAEEAAGSKTGYSPHESLLIANAGIAAFGIPEQIVSMRNRLAFRVSRAEEDVGLEVVSMVNPAETPQGAQDFFAQLKGTIVPPMGKLLCKRIQLEKATPLDLSPDSRAGPSSFEIILDEDTLSKCFLGMKFVATVKETIPDFWFIDHWSECHGTFYTWCWNERARESKEYDDPFELAKPKDRFDIVHPARTDEDRMLKSHAAGTEQATNGSTEDVFGK